MRFSDLIQTKIAQGLLQEDPEQADIILAFDRLLGALENPPKKFLKSRLLAKWFKPAKNKETPRGVYVWGGVGRGKTELMNLFFDAAPTQFKWRVHFHRFMQWVHEQNGQLAARQNPLQEVARLVSDKNRLLCIDEFMVTDIADAMILHQLLKHLYKQGVIIVTTSNIAPDGLYHDGLQRDYFLPAIALIKQHSEVIEVQGDKDFRKQAWICEEIYYSPLNKTANDGLRHCHTQLTGILEPKATTLTIAGRPIKAVSVEEDVAWFNFDEICQTARSQKDYIQLSNQFNTLIISDVPELGADDDASARRFINLIDTAYDYGVNILVSAAKPPDSLYTGSHLMRPFRRTASRLWEMSSKTYLSRAKKIL